VRWHIHAGGCGRSLGANENGHGGYTGWWRACGVGLTQEINPNVQAQRDMKSLARRKDLLDTVHPSSIHYKNLTPCRFVTNSSQMTFEWTNSRSSNPILMSNHFL
jgi:hypothetical protein